MCSRELPRSRYKEAVTTLTIFDLPSSELFVQELVPMDTQQSFTASRSQIFSINRSVDVLKDIADRMASRALGKDILRFSHSVIFSKSIDVINY